MSKYLALAVIAAVAVPAAALAATNATTYYAEQTVKTKYCYVVDFTPNGKAATKIGTAGFDTSAKAAAAIKDDAKCKAPMKMASKTSSKMTTAKPKP